MNDNSQNHRRARPPRLAIIAGGIEQKPRPCLCKSDATFVDAPTSAYGEIGPFFVSCAGCGFDGPEADTWDGAVNLWNDFIHIASRAITRKWKQADLDTEGR